MTSRPIATFQLFLRLPIKAYRGEYDWPDQVRPAYALLWFLILTAMTATLTFPATLFLARYYELPLPGGNILLQVASIFILGTIRQFTAALAVWIVCRGLTTFRRALIITTALEACRIAWGLIPLTPGVAIIYLHPASSLYVMAGLLLIAAVMAIFFLALTFVVFRRALRISAGRAIAAIGCILVLVPLVSELPSRALSPGTIDDEELFLHIRNHVIQARHIVSESLEPALMRGDRILVSLTRSQFPPEYREVWVFYRPGSPPLTPEQLVEASHGRYDDHAMIKRVAGVAGDHIELIPGAGLRRNGQMVEDWPRPRLPVEPLAITVPADHVFVLGDNPDHSSDSRMFGCVPVSHMIGRAVFIFYPFHRMGPVL